MFFELIRSRQGITTKVILFPTRKNACYTLRCSEFFGNAHDPQCYQLSMTDYAIIPGISQWFLSKPIKQRINQQAELFSI